MLEHQQRAFHLSQASEFFLHFLSIWTGTAPVSIIEGVQIVATKNHDLANIIEVDEVALCRFGSLIIFLA